jgi:uncharacterized protein (DUF697 family)
MVFNGGFSMNNLKKLLFLGLTGLSLAQTVTSNCGDQNKNDMRKSIKTVGLMIGGATILTSCVGAAIGYALAKGGCLLAPAGRSICNFVVNNKNDITKVATITGAVIAPIVAAASSLLLIVNCAVPQ